MEKQFTFFRKKDHFDLETFQTSTITVDEHEFSIEFHSKDEFIKEMKKEVKKYVDKIDEKFYIHIQYRRERTSILYTPVGIEEIGSKVFDLQVENNLLTVVHKIMDLVKSVESKTVRG